MRAATAASAATARSLRRPARSLLAGLVTAVLTAACAPPWAVDPQAEDRYEARRVVWESLEGWSVQGRASIQGGGESVTLNVRWHEDAEGYRLNLSGPFGAGAARLEGDGYGVVLDDGRGEPMTAPAPETLVKLYTGHDVPVSALRDWLVGLPANDLPMASRTLDREGRPARYEQEGWRVDYRGWGEVDGVDLPVRVDVRQGDRRLRLALRDWAVERPETGEAPDP